MRTLIKMQQSKSLLLICRASKLVIVLFALFGCGGNSKPLAKAKAAAPPVAGPSETVSPDLTLGDSGGPLARIPEPPTVNLSANDSASALVKIVSGSSLRLKWSSQNATSCVLSGDNATTLSTALNDDSFLISNITATSIYSVECQGPAGQAIDSVIISVVPAPPAVSATLLALGTTATTLMIPYNTSVTFVWWSENAAACTLKDTGVLVSIATENSLGQTLSGITTNKTITLNCQAASGTASASLSINVDPPIGLVWLAASDPRMSDVTILQGANVLLTWNSVYTTSCTLKDGANLLSNASTNLTGLPLMNVMTDKTITLQCSSANPANVSDVLRIHVIPVSVPPPPTVNLKVNNMTGNLSIAYDSSVQVSWSTTNASSCSVTGFGGAPIFSNVIQQLPISYGPLKTSATLTLTCSGAGGSATQSINISVPTGKWIATDGGLQGKYCSQVCEERGYVVAASPEGAKCISGETLAASAFGKVNFKYGCFPNNCPPVAATDATVTLNVKGFCYNTTQLRDWDATDFTVGCFCR